MRPSYTQTSSPIEDAEAFPPGDFRPRARSDRSGCSLPRLSAGRLEIHRLVPLRCPEAPTGREKGWIEADGVTLHFHFSGDPSSVTEYPSAEVIETSEAVTVLPVARDIGQPGWRAMPGQVREVAAKLARPLVGRVLVDSTVAPWSSMKHLSLDRSGIGGRVISDCTLGALLVALRLAVLRAGRSVMGGAARRCWAST